MQQGINGQPMGSIMYRHPEVKPDGWCGEWRSAFLVLEEKRDYGGSA